MLLDNRPTSIHCLHPVATLLEKICALHETDWEDKITSRTFRHFEDCYHIIKALEMDPSPIPPLPTGLPLDVLAHEILLARDVLPPRRLRNWRSAAQSPAWNLPTARRAIFTTCNELHQELQSFYYGERVPLHVCCGKIKEWLQRQKWFNA